MAAKPSGNKSVLVIGLGRFGGSVAATLDQMGQDELAVDKNPELVAKSINRDALKLTDAGLVGLEEQLKALKESDGYLFEGDKPAPEIVKPGSPIRRTPAGGGDLDDFYANNPFYKKKA